MRAFSFARLAHSWRRREWMKEGGREEGRKGGKEGVREGGKDKENYFILWPVCFSLPSEPQAETGGSASPQTASPLWSYSGTAGRSANQQWISVPPWSLADEFSPAKPGLWCEWRQGSLSGAAHAQPVPL